MNQLTLPSTNYTDALPNLNEIVRRAVDGTVAPLQINYANQTIIIGTGGIILTDSGGTGKQCKLQALYDAASDNFTLTTAPYP